MIIFIVETMIIIQIDTIILCLINQNISDEEEHEELKLRNDSMKTAVPKENEKKVGRPLGKHPVKNKKKGENLKSSKHFKEETKNKIQRWPSNKQIKEEASTTTSIGSKKRKLNDDNDYTPYPPKRILSDGIEEVTTTGKKKRQRQGGALPVSTPSPQGGSRRKVKLIMNETQQILIRSKVMMMINDNYKICDNV